MDRRYIDDQHVVARYLADRLTDEERAAFETYYLEHPEVVQEMEAAARFKAGLMRLRDTGELPGLLQSRPRYLQRPYLAAAAAAMAVLALGTLFVLTRPPDTNPLLAAGIEALQVPGGGAPAISGRYAIFRTRGTPVDAEIAMPQRGQAVELRVMPEFSANPARYRVRLLRKSADDSLETIAELRGLVPAPDTFVSLFLDGAQLNPGQYELKINGDLDTDARNSESTFVIRMR